MKNNSGEDWEENSMELADEEAGFRKGRGTRGQINNLRILMAKAQEHQQLLCCVLVIRRLSESLRFSIT